MYNKDMPEKFARIQAIKIGIFFLSALNQFTFFRVIFHCNEVKQSRLDPKAIALLPFIESNFIKFKRGLCANMLLQEAASLFMEGSGIAHLLRSAKWKPCLWAQSFRRVSD